MANVEVSVQVCDQGRLVMGEGKVDDRPGQIEWIVKREAARRAERAVHPSPVAFVDAGHESVTEVQLHLGTYSCLCDNLATYSMT